jgi:8-oxo-dGTP pyrophosphatase MutT (NUDIX family)
MVKPSGVPVRDASTVLLLRDNLATGRPDVWMLTRTREMAFAAGMSVFPGGRVDDADGDLPWAGRSAQTFADEFDCDVALARALVGAAVRETFEETGVLLTTPAAALAHRQPDVEQGRMGFGELLAAHGLAIDADALRPWARWVTPETEGTVRRYDTRFFVAELPAGAEAADLTSESTVGDWIGAADALAAAKRGERMLMPPTVAMLRSIADNVSAAEVLAASASQSLVAVRPVLEVDDEGQLWTVQPDGTRRLLRS